MRNILLAVVAITMLAACGVDRGECLESHTELRLTPVLVGKITIMIPRNHSVCDQWEFPEGRPSA